MVGLPSGTVTFLFTDIEGSTRLWQDHPDAMQPALARHDEILRSAIEAHDGYVVKTTGDGAHAAFPTAADAVAAAIDAQVAIGAEMWALPTPLRVRMGIHTGPAELRDGDYYGTAVNKAARIMSVAHGGQIVMSDAARQLAVDTPVESVDLGEHRLKDLGQPERILQVVHPELEREFPPLRSLDVSPGNLPLQVTSFVGRVHELAALGKALEASRLVTLVGVGGVGKTRLALQVAAEQISRFPDGAWVCELAAADDPDSMLQVVAAALGVRPRPGASLEDSVVESLRPRRVLVVLDNCEHLLLSAAGLADRVLRECAHAQLLATSREALGVAGEQTWPLGSLTIPEADTDGDVLTSDAVHLFLDRAQAARPGFTLSDANTTAVGNICRRLDGIPLALELAAARVVAMSPADISGLLDERFRLLTGGRRSSVERHQTLRATVDWSYSLLDDREQTVFDRLSVFTGSFDASAAQAVVAGEGVEEWGVLDALTDLVAKSMVVAEEAADGAMRYQLLETLRQYGRERLDADGDADGWRRRHAAHYAERAEAAGEGLFGPDDLVWKARLVADLDNVRAAVNWSLERDDTSDVDYAFRIVAALGEISTSSITEVGEWAERLLPRLGDTTPDRRWSVLYANSFLLAYVRGDWEAARALTFDALHLEGLSPRLVVHSRIDLAAYELGLGRPNEAMRWAVDSPRRCDEAAVGVYLKIGALCVLTPIARLVGDHTTARTVADAGLELARRLGNAGALARALWVFALVAEGDDPDAALAALDESVELIRAGATDVTYGGALAHIARLRDRRGDTRLALEALHEAMDHYRRVGPRAELVVVVTQLARTLTDHGKVEPAAVLAGIVSAGALAAMGALGTPERVARITAAARTQLGDTAYDRAFARGAAMSYDDAFASICTALDEAIADAGEEA